MSDGEHGVVGKSWKVEAPPTDSPETKAAMREANNYLSLGKVLVQAQEQAARGKGHDRHVVDSVPFEAQISSWIQGQDFDYARGQAVKKLHESLRMEPEAAIRELLGVINYTAMAIIALENKGGTDEQKDGY